LQSLQALVLSRSS